MQSTKNYQKPGTITAECRHGASKTKGPPHAKAALIHHAKEHNSSSKMPDNAYANLWSGSSRLRIPWARQTCKTD